MVGWRLGCMVGVGMHGGSEQAGCCLCNQIL